MKSSKEITEKMEDLSTMSGRFGNYETETLNVIIEELAQTPLFTLADMQLAFLKGSLILSENNSLDYLENFKKFMKDEYDITQKA